MSELITESCTACQEGAPTVTEEEMPSLMLEIPKWQREEDNGVDKLIRNFQFRDFADALAFTNKIGDLAESHNHHPEITLGWGHVKVIWWTHKISGLHRNDFILAAKSDQLFDS